MTIAEEIARRSIKEIVHFTTNHGVVGTLAKGALLSRRHLPDESLLRDIAHPNALTRAEEATHFDKGQDWLNYANLSISEINRSYFSFSNRWTHNASIFWAILSFDSAIASHKGVFFATTNNVYDHCVREAGLAGFQALFAASIKRKGNWKAARGTRPLRLTTCEQAEVLYPDSVSLDHLRRIYVRTDDHHDIVAGWLKLYNHQNVVVEVAPAKFNGVPN